MPWEILDVLMSLVDNLRQFPSVNNLLIDIHSNAIDEVALLLCIRADYFRDSRAPADT